MFDFLVEELNKPGLNKRRNRHLDSMTKFIENYLVLERGYEVQKELRVTTASAYSKKCDITFSSPDGRRYALELKSISSSFGKNFNNRIEEMAGQAWLLSKSLDGFGYVFVYHDVEDKYTYYEKLKSVLHELHNAKLMHYCMLIKVSENNFVIDKTFCSLAPNSP